ncbi:hypothetical protein RJ640_002522 [Escallonia rubra]|uniref:Uncharacterized protein n=1 Tax=Escallonia rubra TaxID=112253 RepID=A0AA88S2C8_9ASTE|nr:hypothetical protein RJ640_002522 [Escallonia rubra]
MGGVEREKGVLKLVFPGGYVEVLKNPITAAQVMKRNPRHCVTRPDVFKFPWIVIRPESILRLGRVFYVVPYHTIRRLLESLHTSKNNCSNDSSKQTSAPQAAEVSTTKPPPLRGQKHYAEDHDKESKCFSESESISSKEPTRLDGENRFSREQFYGCQPLIEPTRFHRLVKKRKDAACFKMVNHEHKEDGGGRGYFSGRSTVVPADNQHNRDQQVAEKYSKKQYAVEHWPIASRNNHKHNLKPSKPQDPVDIYSSDEKRLPLANQELHKSANHQDACHFSNLKSCLKKNERNSSRSRSLRVSFAVPVDDDDDDKTWRIQACGDLQEIFDTS